MIRNFRIVSPPFWANTVAQSTEVMYDGMYVNATNEDPLYVGKKCVDSGFRGDTSDTVSVPFPTLMVIEYTLLQPFRN